MDWRLRLPSALYRVAVDKAGSDALLAERVRTWLTRYVETDGSQQREAAQARAAALTPERRTEIARLAAQARHRR